MGERRLMWIESWVWVLLWSCWIRCSRSSSAVYASISCRVSCSGFLRFHHQLYDSFSVKSHSFTHTPIHSLIGALTHSYSLIRCITHSLTLSLKFTLTLSHTHSNRHSFSISRSVHCPITQSLNISIPHSPDEGA